MTDDRTRQAIALIRSERERNEAEASLRAGTEIGDALRALARFLERRIRPVPKHQFLPHR